MKERAGIWENEKEERQTRLNKKKKKNKIEENKRKKSSEQEKESERKKEFGTSLQPLNSLNIDTRKFGWCARGRSCPNKGFEVGCSGFD